MEKKFEVSVTHMEYSEETKCMAEMVTFQTVEGLQLAKGRASDICEKVGYNNVTGIIIKEVK